MPIPACVTFCCLCSSGSADWLPPPSYSLAVVARHHKGCSKLAFFNVLKGRNFMDTARDMKQSQLANQFFPIALGRALFCN
eukprot:4364707-Amphidinium_carterae.3